MASFLRLFRRWRLAGRQLHLRNVGPTPVVLTSDAAYLTKPGQWTVSDDLTVWPFRNKLIAPPPPPHLEAGVARR
jgi:hypothetical protein